MMAWMSYTRYALNSRAEMPEIARYRILLLLGWGGVGGWGVVQGGSFEGFEVLRRFEEKH